MKEKLALAVAAASLLAAFAMAANGNAVQAAPVLKPGECVVETQGDADKGTVIRCGDKRGAKAQWNPQDYDYREYDRQRRERQRRERENEPRPREDRGRNGDGNDFDNCHYESNCDDYGNCRDKLVCGRGARP